MRTATQWTFPAVVSTLLTLAPTLSYAADPPPTQTRDLTEAEKLFEQGRQLLDEGKTEAACASFERSYRLDATGGTLLNLADCHERIGRRAEAYREFRKTVELGQAEGWAELAAEGEKRAQALGATFPKLVITVAEPVEGLVVRAGDDPVSNDDFGKPLPVPPGKVQITAEAPGHEPFATELELLDGEQTVAIPALAPTPAPEAAPPPPPSAPPAAAARDTGPEPSESSNWAPWVVVGVGGALVGASVFTGVAALGKESDLEDQCGATPTRCPTGLQDTQDSGKTLAVATDVLWISGAAAIGGGLAWYFLSSGDASGSDSAAVRIAPAVGPTTAAATLTGRF